MAANRITSGGDRHLRTLLTLGAVGRWDDAELLARFVAAGRGEPLGDSAELAFAAIVDRHGPAVLRVARAILGDEASSLDAFQATFLILAQKARTLRVDHSLAPWLASVARRVALGSRKARARRARLERHAARPEAIVEAPSGHHARAETVRTLLAEVDRLPEPFRSAVVACHLDGLTQQAAADHLGWPVGTLQSRLDRGRQKLRDRLARWGLAPTSLATLPPTGLIPTLPATLATTTARTAVLWAIGSTSPTPIAPGVLAILQPTTKGIIMANLKVGTLILGAAIAATASAWTLGVGPSDKPAPVSNSAVASASSNAVKNDGISPAIVAPDGHANAPSQIEDVDIHGFKYPAPAELLSAAGHSTLASNRTDPSSLSEKEPPIQDESPARKVTKKPVLLESKPDDPEVIPPAVDGPDLPTLLCFMTSGADLPGPQETPSLPQLMRFNYPIRILDLMVARDVAKKYKIETVPAYVLVNGSGEKLGQLLGGVESGGIKTKQLAEFYNQYRPKAASASETKEPPLTVSNLVSRPWETAVRIKIHASDKEWGFGSGTIISSTSNETIVLTCARIFQSIRGNESIDSATSAPITLDRFGGDIDNTEARLPCVQSDLKAEIYAIDVGKDLALLRFHPGKILPASPISPEDLNPEFGMTLLTTGCSGGNDVTAWDTYLSDPKVSLDGFGGKQRTVMKCMYLPAPGRSGGGLFTTDGYLVGVCELGEPEGKSGLYASPQTVLNFLKNCGKPVQWTTIASRSFLQSYQVFAQGKAEVPVNYASTQLRKIGNLKSAPQPSVSDQEQRLSDLERKLDRVLQSLDNIRGELGPVRAKGGLGP